MQEFCIITCTPALLASVYLLNERLSNAGQHSKRPCSDCRCVPIRPWLRSAAEYPLCISEYQLTPPQIIKVRRNFQLMSTLCQPCCGRPAQSTLQSDLLFSLDQIPVQRRIKRPPAQCVSGRSFPVLKSYFSLPS